MMEPILLTLTDPRRGILAQPTTSVFFLNWHLSVGLLLTLTDLQLSILYTLTVYRFTLLIGAWRWDVKRGGIVCEGECPGEYVRR